MTKEIMGILMTSVPPHRGLEFQPIDYGDRIGIRLFTDNFEEFSVPQQQDLALWIFSLAQKIWDLGVPVEIERIDHPPYRKRKVI